MVQELKQDNLQEIVGSGKKTIVQFSAGWCGNCRIMKPKFKKFSQDHEEVNFVIVDAEKYPESRKLANVNNLPTFASFDQGEFLNQVQTNKTETLKEFIDETTRN